MKYYVRLLHFLAALWFASLALAQTPQEATNINNQAASIVLGNLNLVRQNYSGYSGAANPAAFMNLRSHAPMSTYKDILDKNVEFRINIPSRHRDNILRLGYLNQHQTGTTSGCLCPDSRNAKEAALINWPKNRYEQLSPYVKPKYGSMGITGASLMGASSYGDDMFILDENKLRGRITYTLADSLGIGSQYFNNQNPLFIPYEFPELVLQLLSKSTPAYAGSQIYANGYTEIQIWGVLRMDMLKEFRFSQAPPSESLSSYFLQNGIRIRQIMCSGRGVGDESCLKDYVAPSVGKLIAFLKAGDETSAIKEVKTVIESGVSPATIYVALENSKKDWFINQVLKLTDLKNQKTENWFAFMDQVKHNNKLRTSLMDQLFDYGDAVVILKYWLQKRLPENQLPPRFTSLLLKYNLEAELIKSLAASMPNLTQDLQKQVGQILSANDKKKMDELYSSVLFSYLPSSVNNAKISQLIMERIAKKENPFTLFSFVRPEIKGSVLKEIGTCVASESCNIPKGASGTYLVLTYAEILKSNGDGSVPKKLWLQYFNELEEASTFKDLPSLTDMAGFSRERSNPPERFYQDLLVALNSTKANPAIVPFEIASEMNKDRKNLSAGILKDLSEKIQKIPYRALVFPEAGMTAPAVPSYYYIMQIRDGHFLVPHDLYPLPLLIARIIERSAHDPNTNTYRLALTNVRQMFSEAKYTQAYVDEAFDLIDQTVAEQYRYIFRQTQHHLNAQINKKTRNFMEAVQNDLSRWFRMSDNEKEAYIKGLDIVPLLILEKMKDDRITKDYLQTLKKYLNSSEFAAFSKSEDFKKFTTERTAWSNYYEDKRVDNKIEDFKKKFEEMAKTFNL